MNQVVAVIVTYNRLALLKKCMHKLLNQTMPCDILIVDNNSTDGTKEYIYNKFVGICKIRIHYKNTGVNLGGAGGFNYGIYWAVKLGYDFIWVMDDDCMPTENALKCFLDFNYKNKNKYGFLSSKVLWKDLSISIMNIQRITMYKNVRDFKSSVVPIVMASFVSLFIPTYIIKEIGLPIKEFFIWTDDWEFTRRISLKYKSYLINKSIVIHESKNNTGANIVDASEEDLIRFSYLYRNDVYLYKREGIKGIIYEIIRLVYHIYKVGIFSPNHKYKRIKLILKSTLKGCYFNPRIEFINTKVKE